MLYKYVNFTVYVLRWNIVHTNTTCLMLTSILYCNGTSFNATIEAVLQLAFHGYQSFWVPILGLTVFQADRLTGSYSIYWGSTLTSLVCLCHLRMDISTQYHFTKTLTVEFWAAYVTDALNIKYRIPEKHFLICMVFKVTSWTLTPASRSCIACRMSLYQM